MARIEPILGVQDVEKSSKWYQTIFEFKSAHGGDTFEMLEKDGNIILCLHVWGEHEHPTITRAVSNNGNGLILYIHVKDLDKVWNRAKSRTPKIEFEPQLNENSGLKEFAIRDLDGYYLLVSI